MKNANKLPFEIDYLAKKMLNGTISSEEKEYLDLWYSSNPSEFPIWELKNENRDQLKERLYQSILTKIELAPANRPKQLFNCLLYTSPSPRD